LINGLLIHETSGGTIMGAGFIRNVGAKNSETSGILSFVLDSTGTFAETHIRDIPLYLVNAYHDQETRNKYANKGITDLVGLKLKFGVPQDDGGMIIVGEQYFQYNAAYPTPYGSKSSTSFHYEDMFLSKLDSTGTLLWMNKLPKRQKGKDKFGNMSFQYVQTPDGSVHLLYIDSNENADISKDQDPNFHSDGAEGFLYGYRVDIETGNFKKHRYFNTKYINNWVISQVSPRRIASTNGNNCVLEVYKGRKRDALFEIKLQ